MGPTINNTSKNLYISTSLQSNTDSNKLYSSISKKISSFIRNFFEPKNAREIIIHHLGGTSVASFDPEDKQTKLSKEHYFLREFPLKT